MSDEKPKQAEINIGTVGHVDHGKSTLVEAFTGKFPDTHSEELRRGITIRLGYGDAEFRLCEKCGKPDGYTTELKCPKCGTETILVRRVAFVDAPGHEVLIATMLAGAAIMDGVMLVIAANEQCPMPQTREHFTAMEITGTIQSNMLVIVQNKIELLSEAKAIENYKQINNFLDEIRGKGAPTIPIIPISAIHKANLDYLISVMEDRFPTPKRDLTKNPLMFIARSFDINKPGTTIENWNGGVIGGTIMRGKFAIGDEIEIRPGIQRNGKWQPIRTQILSMRSGFGDIQQALPGGLIGVCTKLDPLFTKNDRLVGHVVGFADDLPPTWKSIRFTAHYLTRLVGMHGSKSLNSVTKGIRMMLNVGTAKTVGAVSSIAPGDEKGQFIIQVDLDIPIAAELGTRVAISILIERNYRLIGWGNLLDGIELQY